MRFPNFVANRTNSRSNIISANWNILKKRSHSLSYDVLKSEIHRGSLRLCDCCSSSSRPQVASMSIKGADIFTNISYASGCCLKLGLLSILSSLFLYVIPHTAIAIIWSVLLLYFLLQLRCGHQSISCTPNKSELTSSQIQTYFKGF